MGIKLSMSKSDDLLESLPRKAEKGGIIEASQWSGEGMIWTRRELRAEKPIKPNNIEGIWYVHSVVKAMATGKLKFGFSDAKLKKAAAQLDRALNDVLDLYDS
jgi:hypothetical protein